jgi:hypothetical protein
MPYSVTQKPEFLLVTVTGVVTGPDLHQLINDAEAILKDRPRWTNNLADLRGLDLSGLGFSDMLSFSGRRVALKPPNPFRTAIVTDSPAVTGYVRMLQNLNRNPSITIEIFEDIAAAQKWLAAA